MNSPLVSKSFDFGYPNFEPPHWYGLWCPVLDCFMLVHYDLNLLLEIQLLASTKILTVPVELDIELAKQQTIDNQCCVGWTVQDPESINFTFVYQKPKQIWPVVIQPSDPKNLDESTQVQSWFVFLLEWANWLKNYPGINIDTRVKNFICHVMDLPRVDYKQKIYKILLLAKDQPQAEQELKQFLQDHGL